MVRNPGFLVLAPGQVHLHLAALSLHVRASTNVAADAAVDTCRRVNVVGVVVVWWGCAGFTATARLF